MPRFAPSAAKIALLPPCTCSSVSIPSCGPRSILGWPDGHHPPRHSDSRSRLDGRRDPAAACCAPRCRSTAASASRTAPRPRRAALRHGAVASLATETDPRPTPRRSSGAKLVLIGVKPHMVVDLLREIAPVLEPGTIVVSLAAGVTIATMEAALPESVVGAALDAEHARRVVGLGRDRPRAPAPGRPTPTSPWPGRSSPCVGDVVVVPEAQDRRPQHDLGSGPAYVFYLIEQLTGGGGRAGLHPRAGRHHGAGHVPRGVRAARASDVLPADAAPPSCAAGSPARTARPSARSPSSQAGGLVGLFDRATRRPSPAAARSRR